MNKQEFLDNLKGALSGLPQSEIDGRLAFYAEMIDDKVEEGISEEQAVAELGKAEDIASKIISEIPFTRLIKERVKPKRRLSVWEIVLLVLGFPVWFPLIIALFAVILSVYVAIWSIILSLWAVFVSFASSALFGATFGVLSIIRIDTLKGISLIGLGIVFSGLSILMFFACLAATKGILFLTKKTAIFIKLSFIKKGDL
ncbi:MAG: DUF1700 domain-containing protein [Clostridia bacterium]|nr:DUF1700 domain-containing protein [Clostridia bacterium]